ncbi:MAG TPA: hypothetical protein PKE64_16345 [Anaerolineae bacterium]|nr:hypothetical protein [Anaerolineae bacterium]HMR65579.1 hypothetical protein [Anaerolineae bacterium]
MTELEKLLQQVRLELGSEFIATNIVGIDGIAIAEEKVGADFDTNASAARFALVMKLGDKISNRLEMGTMEDNLVTTDRYFILSRFLGNGAYYWNLILTKQATLGYARLLMDEYADKLWAAFPQ